MWYDKRVCLVFPAYNEAANIEQAINSFLSVRIGGCQVVDKVLVIDNNSQDATRELAIQAGATVVHESAQGYGHAIQRGLREADGDLILLAEPDGTFVAEDLIKLCAYSDDFEMVCGTRTTQELIWSEANMGWFLRIGNLLVGKLMEVLYGTCSLSDCGCTFRLLHNSAAKRILPELHVGGSHMLPNMIIAARFCGLSMIEIPLNYRGRVGQSKITGTWKGTLKTGFAMIWLILRSWPRFVQRKNSSPRQAAVS
jgi:glycosyltransferase involved in cell wall biosynthesis